jgi:uncharacterized protein
MTALEIAHTTDGIVARLCAEYQPLQIILFGSYAHNVASIDSDLDFLIIKETQARPIDRWVEVRRILSDPHRRVAIDTLILTPAEISDRLARGDQFIREIIETGEVLYAAS